VSQRGTALVRPHLCTYWIPACAGMTRWQMARPSVSPPPPPPDGGPLCNLELASWTGQFRTLCRQTRVPLGPRARKGASVNGTDFPSPYSRLGQSPAGDPARLAQGWATELRNQLLVPKPMLTLQFKTVAPPLRGRGTPVARPLRQTYPPTFCPGYSPLIPSPLRGRDERLARGDRVE